jgi:hypothetical protein
MRYCLGVFVVFSALAASAASAAAQGYVSIGIGHGAELGGDFDDSYRSEEGAASGRLAIGQRRGPLALEATLFGTDLSQQEGAGELATLALGVDLKYHVGIAGSLEGYLRGGINKTWLRAKEPSIDLGYSGRGYDYGVGLQYTFKPGPLFHAGLWLDFTRQVVTLEESGQAPLDGELDMVTIGVTIGR